LESGKYKAVLFAEYLQSTIGLNIDLEIGGNDQMFNMLMGRTLQKVYNNHEKWVLTTPIINGMDGRKMSQSYNNFISISEEPNEMFGKLMSVSDEVMLEYYEIFTDEDLSQAQKFIQEDPRNAKVRLAKTIVTWLHSAKDADNAEQDFITKFVKKEMPDEMPEFEVKKSEIGILDLISQVTKFADSNSEARRMIQQGGVTLDEKKIDDPNMTVQIKKEMILKVGKRKFAKIKGE